MTAYYNENDPYAAEWLRNLIKGGHIAPGYVDERSIEDVRPSDLLGYTQCHFFAGIGIWSAALRDVGWPDDKPVWTGSCPCQPFSTAGKGAGFDDERHLWPAWFYLITSAKPRNVPIFGEQVASKDGLPWLDLVQTDLEGAGYACGTTDICAAGIGAPHIRQRFYFVANPLHDGTGRTAGGEDSSSCANQGTSGIGRQERAGPGPLLGRCGTSGSMADACVGRSIGRSKLKDSDEIHNEYASSIGESDSVRTSGCGTPRELGDTQLARLQGQSGDGDNPERRDKSRATTTRPGPSNGFWADAEWLYCRDGKWRAAKSGTFPLAYGAPSRVGRLRAYGNGIVLQAAAEFIRATGLAG